MELDDYPPELAQYIDLNRQYDLNEAAGMSQTDPVMKSLADRMDDAWHDAPYWVRVKVDAREFRDVIREAWIERKNRRR
jgi:hypothetical protein